MYYTIYGFNWQRYYFFTYIVNIFACFFYLELILAYNS